MCDPVVRDRVWDRVHQAKCTLRHIFNHKEFVRELKNVKLLLEKPLRDNGAASSNAPAGTAVSEEEYREFMNTHYATFLEFLLGEISVEWIGCLPAGEIDSLLDVFFLHGCSTDAFMVLCNAVTKTSPGFRLNKIVSLLESLVQEGGLADICCAQCIATATIVPQEDLVTYMVTLPDRVINKLQTQSGALFYPPEYVRVLSGAIMTALESIYTALESGRSTTLTFLSILVGKLSLHGHADAVWDHLLPHLLPQCHDNPKWQRVCEKLVTGIPHRYIQAAVSSLVHHLPWYGYMAHFLGNAVVSNKKLNYLLTHKLLLQSYTDKDVVLQNILGYFTSSGTLRPLFTKTLRDVLEVWGDGGALKHTAYEQHFYLSRALILCVAFMGPEELKHVSQGSPPLMTVLMSGMQCHLDSGLAGVRTQGMVVAEALTQALDPTSEAKLTFEYEETEEVRRLKSLLVKPVDPGLEAIKSALHSLNLEEKAAPQANSNATERKLIQEEEELDSDDDLAPYDMSHDQKKGEDKPPLYLRDCMEGLISSEDPLYLDVCLEAAESLIRRHPDHVKELSVEFMKVLLNLQRDHNTTLRLSTMLALTVVDPKPCALYLAEQMYERNYNISHRLDILQVLSSAAQELSDPKPQKKISSIEETSLSSSSSTSLEPAAEPNWREVVQQRIDSKTRRISKGRSVPAVSSANRFAPVAGCFFFPLIHNFDQKPSWLDLFGADHYVLTRLTYTLGIIIHAAINAPILSQMAPALMEYILCVRYHPQSAVRQAVLFATCTLLLAVPSYSLLNQHTTQLAEIKQWLESVCEEDTDAECRQMSVQALMLINKAVKEEYKTDS